MFLFCCNYKVKPHIHHVLLGGAVHGLANRRRNQVSVLSKEVCSWDLRISGWRFG